MRSFFMKKVIATWSGGKDSCFAAYKAMQKGYKLSYLANTVSAEFKRVGLHGIQDILVQQQARLVGVPLLQKAVVGINYEKEFKENLKRKQHVVSGVVFGDIFLNECRSRNERVCKDLGLITIEPLWGRKSIEILKDFISCGFEAFVVSTQASLLGSKWLGRKINHHFIKDIQKLKDIDPCGENGEYHTFVTNGPLFKKKIVITETGKVFRNGYWFLDIQKYQLINKKEVVLHG